MKPVGRSAFFWVALALGIIGLAVIVISSVPGPDPRTIQDATVSEGYAIAEALKPSYRIVGVALVIISAIILRRRKAKDAGSA